MKTTHHRGRLFFICTFVAFQYTKNLCDLFFAQTLDVVHPPAKELRQFHADKNRFNLIARIGIVREVAINLFAYRFPAFFPASATSAISALNESGFSESP